MNELVRFRESFGDFALGDVKRGAAGHAKIGAFILAAHSIDALARLSTTRADGKAAWDQFVPAFLPAYSGACEELYRSYRGLLSHSYSLKGFRLVDREQYRHRHWELEDDERVLHLESFVEDLDKAWSRFSTKFARDAQFRERVLGRARGSAALGSRGGRRNSVRLVQPREPHAARPSGRGHPLRADADHEGEPPCDADKDEDEGN